MSGGSSTVGLQDVLRPTWSFTSFRLSIQCDTAGGNIEQPGIRSIDAAGPVGDDEVVVRIGFQAQRV